jgi:hypothetical protein
LQSTRYDQCASAPKFLKAKGMGGELKNIIFIGAEPNMGKWRQTEMFYLSDFHNTCRDSVFLLSHFS